MSGLTDGELLAAEAKAREMSHRTKAYTGSEVSQAVRSSMRAGHLGDEWMRLAAEVKRRGLGPIGAVAPVAEPEPEGEIGTLTALKAQRGDVLAHHRWGDGSQDAARSATYVVRDGLAGLAAYGVERPAIWFQMTAPSLFRVISRAKAV